MHAVCKRQHVVTLLLSSQQGRYDPKRNLQRNTQAISKKWRRLAKQKPLNLAQLWLLSLQLLPLPHRLLSQAASMKQTGHQTLKATRCSPSLPSPHSLLFASPSLLCSRFLPSSLLDMNRKIFVETCQRNFYLA